MAELTFYFQFTLQFIQFSLRQLNFMLNVQQRIDIKKNLDLI